MSTEQNTAPQGFDRPIKYAETRLENEDGFDLHTSDLVPIEVLRARAAIDAAMQPVEVHAPVAHIEQAPLLPQREVAQIGRLLTRFRQAYQENNFDLGEDGDDEVKTSMFAQPDPRDEGTINLMSDDELDPDMFTSPKPDTRTVTQDMFDKAA